MRARVWVRIRSRVRIRIRGRVWIKARVRFHMWLGPWRRIT